MVSRPAQSLSTCTVVGVGCAEPPGGSVLTMTLADWRKQTAINLDGVFLGVKHSLPVMRESGDGGSIINMSSVAGLKGSASLAGYCATKGGVRLFTKSAALHCARAGYHIRVNSVHPGYIVTPTLPPNLVARGVAERAAAAKKATDTRRGRTLGG